MNHDVLGELHVLKHALQLAGERGPALWTKRMVGEDQGGPVHIHLQSLGMTEKCLESVAGVPCFMLFFFRVASDLSLPYLVTNSL